MKRRLFLWLLAVTSVLTATAQTRTVTGKVTDAGNGTPLPGVTVRIKSGSGGTITNANGEYKLNIADQEATLDFSFTGYLNKQVPLAGKTVLNVALSTDNKQLDEVVVVGYGTQERRDVTGSVGKVKGDQLKNLATSSFDRQLAGQVTGVQVTVPSGVLGQPARIRIRGVSSISSSSEPLYVVDGVPYISGDQGGSSPTGNSYVYYNPLGDINPNDIESVEVLKDGAATAIYGSRASNGVVLITTKKGKLGRARLTYDGWLAAATPSKRFNLMNADEFIKLTNEKLRNVGAKEEAFPTLDPSGKPYDTDWQDIVMRTGFQQNHALSLSGATEQTNYFFSLGYSNLAGISVGNDQQRYSARAKVEQKAFDRVTVGVNVAVTHTTDNGFNANTNALSGNIGGAIRMFPNVPAMLPDGSYNLSADQQRLGRGANTKEIDDNYTNLKYVLDHNVFRNRSLNITGNTFANVEIIKGLNFRTQIGINSLNVEYYRYWDPLHGDGRGTNGSTAQYSLPQFRYNWQNTLSFNRSFGVHKVGAVAGLEYQKSRARFFFAEGTDMSNPFFGGQNLISDVWATGRIGGSVIEKAFQSVFARANYSFNDRYLISATIRHDKISDLPAGRQGVTLPGASVGWRISQEQFFRNASGLRFISDLKLRGGFAKVGNVEIGDYPYAGIYKAVRYGELGGMQFGQIFNPNLSFETSKKVNIGLDVAFLDDRIQFTAEYFRNDIDNLILAAPVPPSLGVPKNQINMNIGKMYNQGVEFSASGSVFNRGAFRWNVNANFTMVKNRVTQLANGNADIVDAYNITRVGESIGTFFGFKSAGVNPANGFALWEKADGSIIQGVIAPNGTSSYAKYDPSKPADISQSAAGLTFADKRILGQANPTWYGGLTNSFAYKNFDLSIALVFSGGNKVYNATRQESLTNMKFQNGGRELLDRWTTPGQQTDVPKVFYGSGAGNFINQNGSANSRFLENGNFLRAQNISLGYNLPASLLGRAKISSLRIYAQVQNAFIITSYSGLDPELNSYALASGATTNGLANRQPGIDWNANPIPRTYTFGINLGL
ncbi:TonB-dependent receptor [Chitinophaga pendula]|uniref:SusC/RagA family TonB-linked outer membrane protein n=1 Tax=Chitinophaga TaxID=79328 RepID=UPI0012FE1E4B|nr:MULTISPECIES: TonB-dependent receptor [Chitinophaga]UCJ07977.1 TonB-dependent receptor [Chitinophaga pendula]